MGFPNANPAGGREPGPRVRLERLSPKLAAAAAVLAIVLLVALGVAWTYLLSLAALVAGGTIAMLASRERARYERVAGILERAFVPPELPPMPGWETATLYRSAGEGTRVGGDFFDAFHTPDGWMVVIGDVGGHGVEAAAFTALARYTLRTAGSLTGDPAAAVERLDRWLAEREEMALCTVAAVSLRTGGEATVVSAGHPAPLLVRAGAGSGEAVEAHGSLLGAFSDPHWDPVELALDAGDQLVLYTDGVVEAPCTQGRFGDSRLMRAVSAASAPEEAIGSVREALEQAGAKAGADDDLAMVAIMRTAFVSGSAAVSKEARMGTRRERFSTAPVGLPR